MDNFYLILACLGIGLLLRRAPGMPPDSAVALNGYALNVALPAVILANVPLLNVSSALLIPALTPWLLMLLVIALLLTLARLLRWSRELTGALLIVVPLGNTSYLGFPLVQSFFGQEAMPYAVVYDQLGSFIALAVYAPVIAALYGSAKERPAATAILARIFTFPPFIALIAGLLLRGVQLPPLANQLVDMLAATLIPVVMVAVGLQVTARFQRREVLPLTVALGIKLLLMPACAWLLWLAMGQAGLATRVAVFQAAMPSMISAGAIAIGAGLAPRLVAGIVGLGLMLSFLSLPLLYWLLTL
ncbi:AEC family transporter [Haliea sp. E1-2-M8]|uniref:AEC family transporter n=1 Tax=Haliea sp. E1-2-M8 TaxID=3064706 RepID=UPI00271F3D65|nr:AEC family transporter [Haliea sp. E1-2-M8]MDO8860401.1 AEC family transporter [Haliea sp. E1-2-M8]